MNIKQMILTRWNYCGLQLSVGTLSKKQKYRTEKLIFKMREILINYFTFIVVLRRVRHFFHEIKESIVFLNKLSSLGLKQTIKIFKIKGRARYKKE